MDSLLHIGNVILLVSFTVSSMMLLRGLNIVAGFFFLGWALHADPPIYASAAWTSLFGLVNIFQIWKLILDRRPPKLSEQEQWVHQNVFTGLDARAFKQLVELGEWKEQASARTLIDQGTIPDRVWLIAKGCIEVRRGDKTLHRLQAGDFFGEAAFLAPCESYADLVTTEDTQSLSWSFDELNLFLEKHADVCAVVQRTFGMSLVRKLKSQS